LVLRLTNGGREDDHDQRGFGQILTYGELGKTTSSLKEEIIRLGPWHIDVQVTPEISTRVSLEAPEGYYGSSGQMQPGFINPREGWIKLIKRIYPEGLEGRTFLECACNCGAYCFWAKEIGASRCFGFDVREHWIEQARFLARNRTVASTEGVSFEKMDLYELPNRGLEPFDVTLFKGIFYHLPDPITGLKAAADLTKELLILHTAVRINLPDGMLAISGEGSAPLMSGVYDLNWIPTGPRVLTMILNWMGFPQTRVTYWRRSRPQRNPERGERFGRMVIVASRQEGLLEQLESVEKPPVENRQQKLVKSTLRERDRRIVRLERQLGGREQELRHSREKRQKTRQRLRHSREKEQRLIQQRQRLRRRTLRRTLRLKRQLQSMQASRSWRLVEMLRRIRAKISRVGRKSS
jgi:tRNA (mo5U34)-methyltransferase